MGVGGFCGCVWVFFKGGRLLFGVFCGWWVISGRFLWVVDAFGRFLWGMRHKWAGFGLFTYNFDIYPPPTPSHPSPPTAPLGIRAYGTHITGYTHSPEDGRLRIWVQKRALDKPTYPGMMDSMVGGGITAGLTPRQVMMKEAHEEAGIPEHLAGTAVSAGCVS